MFTVYLGNLYYDVDLVAVTLNGHDFTILEANKSGLVITMVPQPNSTLHAYILRVPFEDAVVHKLVKRYLFLFSNELLWFLSISS